MKMSTNVYILFILNSLIIFSSPPTYENLENDQINIPINENPIGEYSKKNLIKKIKEKISTTTNLFDLDLDSLKTIYATIIFASKEDLDHTDTQMLSALRPLLYNQKFSKQDYISLKKELCSYLTIIFSSYIIFTTGTSTFIHEYCGHLLLGGALITNPSDRYSSKYPSKYYQVGGFDEFLDFEEKKDIKSFVNWFLTPEKKYSQQYSGFARPYLNMTSFTNLGKTWGGEQSHAWTSLSGSIPSLLLSSIIFSYLGSKKSNLSTVLTFMMLPFYLSPCSYSFSSLSTNYSLMQNNSTDLSNDFISWSYHMGKHLNKNSTTISAFTFCAFVFIPLLSGLVSYGSGYETGDLAEKPEILRWIILDENSPLSKNKFKEIINSYPLDKRQDLLESLEKKYLTSENESDDHTTQKKELFDFFQENFSNKEKTELLKSYFEECGYIQHDLPAPVKKIKNFLFFTYIMSSFFQIAATADSNNEAEQIFYQLNLIGPLLYFCDLSLCLINTYQSSIDSNTKMNLIKFFETIFISLNFTMSVLNYIYYDISDVTQIWGRGYTIASLFCSFTSMGMHRQYEKEIKNKTFSRQY
jgi:hypothetical protein